MAHNMYRSYLDYDHWENKDRGRRGLMEERQQKVERDRTRKEERKRSYQKRRQSILILVTQ